MDSIFDKHNFAMDISPIEMIAIGKRIKAARKAKGMSQQDLAEKIGIAQQTINRYESGKMIPRFIRLLKIAEALNVPIDSLVTKSKRESLLMSYIVIHDENGHIAIDLKDREKVLIAVINLLARMMREEEGDANGKS